MAGFSFQDAGDYVVPLIVFDEVIVRESILYDDLYPCLVFLETETYF